MAHTFVQMKRESYNFMEEKAQTFKLGMNARVA
jgi:hypothetical protein